MSNRPPAPGLFDHAPFLAFWETTQACELACKHCRACAQPARDAAELTTHEGFALMKRLRAMGCPLLVLTGGDPAQREDLTELVRFGTDIGLRVALTPSATSRADRPLLQRLAEAGLARLAVSVDGAGPRSHDAFRGVAGSFERSMEILRDARALSLTTQVNTTVTRHNVDELEALADALGALEIELWSVFFVVPTGRAKAEDVLDPAEVEAVLERLAKVAERAPFDVKTTAAPHFRRVLLQQKFHRDDVVGIRDGIGRAPRGVNDGQGIVFVSHRGDISPSGFLPVVCGNVRRDDVAEVYRAHPLFKSLRDPDALGGKCGLCEFRKVCGGSRARAWAVSGDPLGEEPSCAHVPAAMQREGGASSSSPPPSGRRGRERIVVLGAGVSGLSAGVGLSRAHPGAEVLVLEAQHHAGGLARTERHEGGWLLERGPDALVATSAVADALRELGLHEAMRADGPAPRRSFILSDGRMLPVPAGVMNLSIAAAGPLLASGLLSAKAKLRWLAEPTIAAKPTDEDESVWDFCSRRFGDEFAANVVEPLLRGIYGASTKVTSAQAVIPKLVAMEREHASVATAMAKALRSGAAHAPLVTLRDGMGALTDALAARLGDRVKTGAPARRITRHGRGLRVDMGLAGAVDADRVVLATPPWVSAKLVEGLSSALAETLGEIPSAPLATVTVGVKREQIERALDGTGFVNGAEGADLEACTWASRKWEGRAPEGHELLRCFVRRELAQDEAAMVFAARRGLSDTLGVRGEPLFTVVHRAARARPVYRVGHRERVSRARDEAAAAGALVLVGNGYDAMGVGECLLAGLAMV